MRNPKRHIRLVLRLVAIGLVVVGAILASSWFEVLLQAAVEGASGETRGAMSIPPDGLGAIPWAIPALIVGVALLVVTTKRERFVSLGLHADD